MGHRPLHCLWRGHYSFFGRRAQIRHFMVDSHRRSLAEAVSWRIFSSIDTFMIGWVIIGRLAVALSISGVELFKKLVARRS
jgi:uncharacterized membrane protein